MCSSCVMIVISWTYLVLCVSFCCGCPKLVSGAVLFGRRTVCDCYPVYLRVDVVCAPSWRVGCDQHYVVPVLLCYAGCMRVCIVTPICPWLLLFGSVSIVLTWFLLCHIHVDYVVCVSHRQMRDCCFWYTVRVLYVRWWKFVQSVPRKISYRWCSLSYIFLVDCCFSIYVLLAGILCLWLWRLFLVSCFWIS
jgi:hypothetical protein